MNTHSAFDDKYWNLAQACAWVEFRESELVEDFAAADRRDYLALHIYTEMWPAGRKLLGSVDELRRALEETRLKSWGYHMETQEHLQEVPSAEWADFVIRPPFAYVARGRSANSERWSDIRVLSADMKRLWRSVNEVEGRSMFDWVAVKKIYNELKPQNPDMSHNELILEIQGTFRDRFNKKPPGRTTIQNKIETWA